MTDNENQEATDHELISVTLRFRKRELRELDKQVSLLNETIEENIQAGTKVRKWTRSSLMRHKTFGSEKNNFRNNGYSEE